MVDYVVQSLQDSLSGEMETNVVIHDIEKEGEDYRYRKASFTTHTFEGVGWDKVFKIEIGSEFVDPDGGTAGWTQWRMLKATFSYRGRTIELRPGSYWDFTRRQELPPLAREFIVSYVNGRDVSTKG